MFFKLFLHKLTGCDLQLFKPRLAPFLVFPFLLICYITFCRTDMQVNGEYLCHRSLLLCVLWLVVLGTKHSLAPCSPELHFVLLYRKMKVLLKLNRSMVRLYIGIDLRSLLWDKTYLQLCYSAPPTFLYWWTLKRK